MAGAMANRRPSHTDDAQQPRSISHQSPMHAHDIPSMTTMVEETRVALLETACTNVHIRVS
jgi:hypothetical protein